MQRLRGLTAALALALAVVALPGVAWGQAAVTKPAPIERVHKCDTVALLADKASFPRLKDGDYVELLGYYSAGDGGGQTLIYHATGRSEINVDNGWYFDGFGADDYFEAADKSVAYVQRFGGYNDGDTDNSTVLSTIISALPDSGGHIHYGKGVYYHASAVTINKMNVLITGTGKRNIQSESYVVPESDAATVPTTIFIPTSGTWLSISATNACNGLQVRDLTVSGPSPPTANASRAFDFDKAGSATFRRNFQFRNISVTQFDYAWHFRDSVGGGDKAWGVVKIEQCNVMHNARAVWTDNSVQLNGFKYCDNESGQNGYGTAGTGCIKISAHKCTIEDNILEGQRDPITVNGYNGVNIVNNYFEANTGDHLIEVAGGNDVRVGPNANTGSHTSLDQTVVVRECRNVSVADRVHPFDIYLTPSQVMSNTAGSSYAASLLTGSTRPFAYYTDCDPAWFEPPYSASNEVVHSSYVAGSCRDGFRPGADARHLGMRYGTAALIAPTCSHTAFSYTADEWIVACFTMYRETESTSSPYISFRVNGSGSAAASWEGSIHAYRDIEGGRVKVFVIAARAQEDSADSGTTMQFYLWPYGQANAAQSWGWSISPIHFYKISDPTLIRPWFDRSSLYTVTEAPTGTSCNWQVGDTLRYRTPTAGGAIGVVCTTAATPGSSAGTWKAFGAIEE